jgi:hypothetical protein
MYINHQQRIVWFIADMTPHHYRPTNDSFDIYYWVYWYDITKGGMYYWKQGRWVIIDSGKSIHWEGLSQQLMYVNSIWCHELNR